MRTTTFGRRDREVGMLVLLAKSPKAIANSLELDVATVYGRIREMCQAAGVRDRSELLVWFMQNPNALRPGVTSPRGLHKQPCDCGCSYCSWVAVVRTSVARDLDLDHAA